MCDNSDKQKKINDWLRTVVTIVTIVLGVGLYVGRLEMKLEAHISNKECHKSVSELSHFFASNEKVDDLIDRLDRIENKLDLIIAERIK